MNPIVQHIIANWKTTVSGLLSAWLAISAALTGADFAGVQGFHQTKWFLIAGVVAKVLLGMIQSDAKSTPPASKVVPVLLLILCAGMASAQVAPVDPSNLYLAGTSYSQGATPSTAGTALYARKLADNNGYTTYAFTMVDVIPASIKPFTVSTNIGAGIAQKAFIVAGVPVYIPTAAGISFNGNNVGWVWNTGVGVPFEIKRQGKAASWYIMPTVRINKASTGGSGYQPIVGVLFGWGQ